MLRKKGTVLIAMVIALTMLFPAAAFALWGNSGPATLNDGCGLYMWDYELASSTWGGATDLNDDNDCTGSAQARVRYMNCSSQGCALATSSWATDSWGTGYVEKNVSPSYGLDYSQHSHADTSSRSSLDGNM